MKLTYYPFEPFEIEAGKPTVIETGNFAVYQKLILNFKDLQDDVIFSDEQFKQVETDKTLNWIGDPMLNSNLNKLFQTHLYKQMHESMTDDLQQKITEDSTRLKTDVLELGFLLDLPLKVEEETDFTKVFKYAGIQFDTVTSYRAYDIIETILKTMIELNDSKIIGLMNVSDYLTDDEFSEVTEMVNTLNSKVLLIKFSENKRPEKFNGCRYYYIDRDFVDWRY